MYHSLNAPTHLIIKVATPDMNIAIIMIQQYYPIFLEHDVS